MNRNSKKKVKRSRSQGKAGRPTKVNKIWANDDKLPATNEEGGEPDDISKKFPNFSLLTAEERQVLFEALTTARKNVEKKGVPTRQRFGTVHDEYLENFDQNDKREDGVSQLLKPDSALLGPSCTRICLQVGDSPGKSSGDDGPSSPNLLVGRSLRTLPDGFVAEVLEPESSKDCKNTNKTADFYAEKEKKAEKSAFPLIKSLKPTENKEVRRPKKESSAPKAKDTPRFDALNSEEKRMFFKILNEARSNVMMKNPEKRNEILPMKSILRLCQGQEKRRVDKLSSRGKEEKGNLKVKITVTSGDNEMLRRTKSQETPSKECSECIEDVAWTPSETEDEILGKEGRKRSKAESICEEELTREVVSETKDSGKDVKEERKQLATESICEEKPATREVGTDVKDTCTCENVKKGVKQLSIGLICQESPADKRQVGSEVKDTCTEGNVAEGEKQSTTGCLCEKKPVPREDSSHVKIICSDTKKQSTTETICEETPGPEEKKEKPAKHERKKKEKCKCQKGVTKMSSCQELQNGKEMDEQRSEKRSKEFADREEGVKKVESQRQEREQLESGSSLNANKATEGKKAAQREEGKGSSIGVRVEAEKCESLEKLKKAVVEKEAETSSACTLPKVMIVDDNVIEKIRMLICSLEEKARKDESLEREYLKLLVDYVDYLSRVLESLLLRQQQRKQVHAYAAQIHLQFEDKETKKEGTKMEEPKENKRIPRSVSDEGLGTSAFLDVSKEDIKETPTEKESDEMLKELDSDLSLESEELNFVPPSSSNKKVVTTKIRLLQDLLEQRAEFVEGEVEDFKIVHHPEKEYVPVDKPPAVKHIKEEAKEGEQENRSVKFLKMLIKFFTCGRKRKREEEGGIFENLKGEAVRVDVTEGKKDPANATLNQSTMEVLNAAGRKKIIEKYYSTE